MRATKESLLKVMNGLKNKKKEYSNIMKSVDNDWIAIDIAIHMIERVLSDEYRQTDFDEEIAKYDLAYSVDYWISCGDDNTNLISDFAI